MSQTRTVTGVEAAFVRVGSGDTTHEVLVAYGDDLPDNVAPGELARLEGLGVFEAAPRRLVPPDQRPPLPAGDEAEALRARIAELEADDSVTAAGAAEAEALRARVAQFEQAGGGPSPLLVSLVEGMSVEQVRSYADAHPDAKADLLAAEQAGKARKGVVDGLS